MRFITNERIIKILESKYTIKDGCYLWLGSINSLGYGVVKVNKKLVYVHRLAAKLFFEIDLKNIQISQSCYNKRCFNPDHLKQKVVRIIYNDF